MSISHPVNELYRISDKMPDINYSPPIQDLFANFALNWATLWPVMAVLMGVLFGTFLLKKAIKLFKGED